MNERDRKIRKLQKLIIRKIYVVIALTILISFTYVSSTFSYLTWTNDDPLKNIFKIGKPGLEIDEDFNGDKKENITVDNTGNTSVYVRVNITSTLIDENCNPEEECTIYPGAIKANFNLDQDKWILIDEYYYYRNILEPNSSTPDLLNGGSIKNQKNPGMKLKVDVLAQSIQSEPKEIVSEKWKVKIENDKIVGRLE